ncbi:MAG: hypothetical protein ACREA3_04740 [Nitrosotalea sp.]
MLKIILVLSGIGFILISTGQAYAAFDSDGNYYCNAGNLPLEKTIYKDSISKINANLQEYKSLNPDTTVQDLHNYLASSQDGTSDSYYIMNQAKACLDSNGINSLSVAVPSPYLLQVFSAPEFSGFLVLVLTMAIVLVFQRYSSKSAILLGS